MPKEIRPTVSKPLVKNNPRCFKCERYIRCAVKTDSSDDYWAYPLGLSLSGGDSYGSTLYDSMTDGIGVNIVVCDECLAAHKKLIREVKRQDTWW